MSGKTIFIIIATILVTIVLMNNNDDMELWLFGISRIPKLAVLGTMLAIGFICGFMAGKPGKKADLYRDEQQISDEEPYLKQQGSQLSDEDRDYIS